MRNLHLILVLLSLTACSSSLNRTLNKARRVSENKPYEALKILDQKLQNTDSASAKLKILSTIEEIIKTKVKKADFYKAVLEKKHHYLDDPKEKVETSLLLAQLLIQNLRQEEEALDYLENIETEHLSNKQREQYFQLILVAYLNTKKMDQALFEAESILKKKDLTPSERFKVSLLKARILGEQKNIWKLNKSIKS